MNQGVGQRSHPRITQPDLRRTRGVDRMRDPGERIGDRRGIFFLRLKARQEAVILMVVNIVQRRRRNIMPLLVAGRHHPGFGVDADKRLPQAPAEDGARFAVRRNAQHGAVVLPECRRLLPALGDDEGAIRREFH